MQLIGIIVCPLSRHIPYSLSQIDIIRQEVIVAAIEIAINANPRNQYQPRLMLRHILRKNEKELSAFAGTEWKANKNESVVIDQIRPIRLGIK